MCAYPAARKYSVRWLGSPPEQDTWDSRSSILREITDVFRYYESLGSGHPGVIAGVNYLAVKENGEAICEVKNEKNTVF
uniref:Chromo domain-containing protein n=1 Tax=Peronospora matthiolae TaxID=2874970 RepID=A0AAV1TRR3_9STRA